MSDTESSKGSEPQSKPTESSSVSPPTAPPPAATQPSAPPSAKGGRGLAIFAILLSLGALGATGYGWFQNQVTRVEQESRVSVGVSEIGAQVSRLGDHIARLQKDQADVVTEAELSARLLQLENAVEKAEASLALRQEAIEESVLKLGAELERGVDQFVVDEVSQLLRLANNSLLFGKDIEAAINALGLADEQLKGLKDPRYALVRTQINEELSALSRVTVPDTEAISARLHSVSQQIPTLPLLNEPEERGEAEIAAVASTQETTFRSELKKIWHDLVNSISIQRVDQPPKPLLVPEQRYFLNENIKLALAKAELSLLQAQPEAYRRNLGDAAQWLREYFDLGDETVAVTLDQITDLAAMNIDYQVPDITGSYQALQAILGGR